MKLYKILVLAGALFIIASLVGCYTTTQTDIEQSQQAAWVEAITRNQPVPDLGGYSFEREIVIQTYQARNHTISTWAYTITGTGQIIELCPSIGYPIPYSTQLTNPDALTRTMTGNGYYVEGQVANPEPNGLYPPADAAATLIQCVNSDGSVSPMYFEWYVFAMPYRIKSDAQFVRVDDNTSFSVKLK